jgi:hypothetical protein
MFCVHINVHFFRKLQVLTMGSRKVEQLLLFIEVATVCVFLVFAGLAANVRVTGMEPGFRVVNDNTRPVEMLHSIPDYTLGTKSPCLWGGLNSTSTRGRSIRGESRCKNYSEFAPGEAWYSIYFASAVLYALFAVLGSLWHCMTTARLPMGRYGLKTHTSGTFVANMVFCCASMGVLSFYMQDVNSQASAHLKTEVVNVQYLQGLRRVHSGVQDCGIVLMVLMASVSLQVATWNAWSLYSLKSRKGQAYHTYVASM